MSDMRLQCVQGGVSSDIQCSLAFSTSQPKSETFNIFQNFSSVSGEQQSPDYTQAHIFLWLTPRSHFVGLPLAELTLF